MMIIRSYIMLAGAVLVIRVELLVLEVHYKYINFFLFFSFFFTLFFTITT
jgi:hypothetical protein